MWFITGLGMWIMDKGRRPSEATVNGKQKCVVFFCNLLLCSLLRSKGVLPDLKKHGEKIGCAL